MGYGEVIYSDKEASGLLYNSDGDTVREGFNLVYGLKAGASYKNIYFYMNPVARLYGPNSVVEGAFMKKAFIKAEFHGLELEAGRDSMWWGPGYHGSLLLSNNPRPLNLIKIGNSHPLNLPWRLGLFGYSVFVSKLESDRADVPGPFLWGMRLVYKPSPYIEAGLSRTAMLGGRGRSEDAGAWWSSITGEGENETGKEPGDQKAGFDLSLTLPFKAQPLKLYAEAAGEDESGGFPSKWAYLFGIYLPRPLAIQKIDLRAEYANNHVSGSPDVWYTHHIYTSGYTYKGRVIGHHMGTDSDDIFIGLSYLPVWRGRVFVSFDRERHGLSEPGHSTFNEAKAGGELLLNRRTNLSGAYSHGRLKNGGQSEDINLFSFGLGYSF